MERWTQAFSSLSFLPSLADQCWLLAFLPYLLLYFCFPFLHLTPWPSLTSMVCNLFAISHCPETLRKSGCLPTATLFPGHSSKTQLSTRAMAMNWGCSPGPRSSSPCPFSLAGISSQPQHHHYTTECRWNSLWSTTAAHPPLTSRTTMSPTYPSLLL